MAGEITFGNRVAAGISAFRQAGGGQRAQSSQPAAVSIDSPAPKPAERRAKTQPVMLSGIPGQEGTSTPRGSYVDILV